MSQGLKVVRSAGLDYFPAVDMPGIPRREGESFFAAAASFFGYDAFATAIPTIAAAVELTHGPIVEIGSGFASTPLLGALAQINGRRIVSLETEPEWAAVAAWFGVRAVPADLRDVDDVVDRIREVYPGARAGVVLVDGEQERRGPILRRVLDLELAEVVVAHDWDPDRDASGAGVAARYRESHRHPESILRPHCARSRAR